LLPKEEGEGTLSLIDDQEKYLVYKDIFDNLFIDNVYELQMTEEIL